MSAPYVAPSTKETAFNCPHCGALAKQFWHQLLAEEVASDKVPISVSPEEAEKFGDGIDDAKARERMIAWGRRMAKKLPFLAGAKRDPYALDIYNLYVSKCFNCDDIAMWIGDTLAYPQLSVVPAPNVDLSDEAKRDYREAAAIVEKSPRGAAALLRLAIQIVVIDLGCDGKNLNDDIASLVAKGLDKRVQQALDVVRVVGNNAVHPGELDIRDDATTARRLFELLNLIADIMISQPKHVASLYETLPEGARAAVERRDKADAAE
jgi:hypothetical protein